MELQAVDGVLRVLYCHDLPFVRSGDTPETFRKAFRVCRQRVVPGHRHPLRKSPKDRTFRIDGRHGLLSVHESVRVSDDPSICLADGLMAEAHTEGRDLLTDGLRRLHDDPGVLRPPVPARG